MQEIYIQEKGKEALRAMEITIKSERVKDEPKLDGRSKGKKNENEDNEEEPVSTKTKKQLTVSKGKDGKTSNLKVTTILLKDEPKTDKKRGRSSSKKPKAKKSNLKKSNSKNKNK